MSWLLIIWLYQPPGFSNTLIGHVATQKVEMPDEKTCRDGLNSLMNRGNGDIVVNGDCIRIGNGEFPKNADSKHVYGAQP